jgi:prophage regulatory protein
MGYGQPTTEPARGRRSSKGFTCEVSRWRPSASTTLCLAFVLMVDLYSMSANVDPGDIIRIEQVLATTGLCRTRLYQLIREGTFPLQVALGARAVGWRTDEVIEWKRNRPVKHAKEAGIRGAALKTPSPTLGILAIAPVGASRVSRRKAADPSPDAEQAVVDKGSNASPIQSDFDVVRGATLVVVKAKSLSTAAREMEQLHLLRSENAHLRELLVDLVLRNDRLQSDIRNISMHS